VQHVAAANEPLSEERDRLYPVQPLQTLFAGTKTAKVRGMQENYSGKYD